MTSPHSGVSLGGAPFKRNFAIRALIHQAYGPPDVLRTVDLNRPTPGAREVLVEVRSASINAADWHLLTADIFLVRLGLGLLEPRHHGLGADVAGRVAAVGQGVTHFQVGGEVYGDVLRDGVGGSLAEYVCADEGLLAHKPASLSFDEAAAVPLAGVTALQALRDTGELQPGQSVLIHGASGGVGTFAVQLAKVLGAHVTALCSTAKVDTIAELGPDRVIDYQQQDFARDPARYDLIVAANGDRSILDFQRALTPTGTYVCVGGSLRHLMQAMLLGPLLTSVGEQRFRVCSAKARSSDLEHLSELIEAGHLRPVMDRSFDFEDAVEAFRYFGQGHVLGKVVVRM